MFYVMLKYSSLLCILKSILRRTYYNFTIMKTNHSALSGKFQLKLLRDVDIKYCSIFFLLKIDSQFSIKLQYHPKLMSIF